MSFESAQQILQMYYQTNQQRINDAMEMAYNEALSRFKNETAAREAALEILAQEEKSWRAYQKEIASIRREQMKGNIQIAKINSERSFYNLKEQNRVDDTNRMREYLHKAKTAEIRAIGGEGFRQKQIRVVKDATDYADEQTTGKQIFNAELEAVATNLINELQKPQVTEADLYNAAFFAKNGTLHGGLDKARREARITKSDASYPEIVKENLRRIDKNELANIRLKDLGDLFIQGIVDATGKSINDPEIQIIKDYVFGGTDTDLANVTGRLSDVADVTDDDKAAFKNEQYNVYYDAFKPLLKESRAPVIRGKPPKKKAILKEEMKPIDYGGEDLARRASAVFDALNARDDTPFEIDEQERKEISQDAFDAYEELKRVVPKDPLSVTFEERTLLDDTALERQLSILRQRQQIGRMSPYMASPEVIRARAGELLEPGAKRVQVNIPADAQRFYATENDAFKMSDRSDIDIQNMGVPEQAGVSLYKQMFDPTQGTLKDGQTYGQVLNKINEFFPDDKEQQLRAITAFNSRAMALQRSRNPLVLKDGSKNVDYLEALKALGK